MICTAQKGKRVFASCFEKSKERGEGRKNNTLERERERHAAVFRGRKENRRKNRRNEIGQCKSKRKKSERMPLEEDRGRFSSKVRGGNCIRGPEQMNVH